jgi:hypothetical protein
VVKSRMAVATPRRPLELRGTTLNLLLSPTAHRPDRIGCHGLPDHTVMRYFSAGGPDSPTVRSHPVGGCCVVNGGETIEVVVTSASHSRSAL